MSATAERNRAIQVAASDFEKALSLARQVSEPWFRCQALAWAARFAPETEVIKTAEEALTSAFSAKDPYHTVGASAWPIRALIERGHEHKALHWLAELVAASATIENPVSRLKALFLLWQAVHPVKSEAKKSVLGALTRACQAADSWQAGWTLRETALILARDDVNEAMSLMAFIPEGVYKRQAQQRIAQGQRGYVHPFYETKTSHWHDARSD